MASRRQRFLARLRDGVVPRDRAVPPLSNFVEKLAAGLSDLLTGPRAPRTESFDGECPFGGSRCYSARKSKSVSDGVEIGFLGLLSMLGDSIEATEILQHKMNVKAAEIGFGLGRPAAAPKLCAPRLDAVGGVPGPVSAPVRCGRPLECASR